MYLLTSSYVYDVPLQTSPACHTNLVCDSIVKSPYTINY